MFWLEKIVYYFSFFAFFVVFLGLLLLPKRRFFAVVFLVLSLGFIYVRFIEPKILLTNHYAFLSPGNTGFGLKIAVVADFHYGIYKNPISLERTIKQINQENPDLVLLPGDFVYHAKSGEVPGMFKAFGALRSPAFAVFGNHDVGLLGEINVRQALGEELSKNVRLLQNEMQAIEIKGRKIVVVGFSELWEGKTDFALLKNLPEADFTVVLAHNPDTAYGFLENSGVNLVVSGHTHGGQIRVPFLYKKMIPTFYPFDKGFYNVKGVNVFVTSGVGMTGWPFRFLIPPEIAIIEI